MSTQQPFELVACPECGASGAQTDARCWLCGRLRSSPQGDAAWARTSSSRTDRPGTTGGWRYGFTAILVFVALAAVVVGLYSQQPGLAIVVVVVATPALVATAVSTVKRRGRGRPLSFGEQAGQFVLWVAVILGGAMLLALAAFGAFFIWCLMELGSYGTPGHGG